MQIDQYGFEATSVHFRKTRLQPYKVDDAGDGVTYLCFENGASVPIHRITVSGTVTTVEWALGAWGSRAALAYIPINQTRNVQP